MDVSGKTVLVAGASSAIGQALLIQVKALGAFPVTVGRLQGEEYDHCQVNLCDQASVSFLHDYLERNEFEIDLVINCIGYLHDDEQMPERQVKDINDRQFMKSFEVNVLSHVHLAQALDSFARRKHKLTWLSLSAMVSSISDNALGGWHSYRMSKAALNMFVKGLAIEWRRYNKQNCVVAIHPGTTESAMTSPFKVRPDKLYSAELTAERLLSVIQNLKAKDNGSFLNWTGEQISY